MRRIIGFFACSLLLAGCAAPQPPGSTEPSAGSELTPKYGGQFNFPIATDPRDWDMSYAGKSSPNDSGIALGYNSLLGFQSGPDVDYAHMAVRPELAERWEISPDARTFTFSLRRGVKFGNLPPVNGRELQAADVKWSYEYGTRTGDFKDKKLPTGQFDYMYQGLERIETPDPYTVVVKFSQPFVPFLAYMASDWSPIVPHEIFDQDGHLQNRIVGTGPFLLDTANSQKGSRWVWKKNPDYWDAGKPYLDEIRWLVLPSDATAHAGFQTKQVDLLNNLSSQDFREVSQKNLQATIHKYLQVKGLHLWLSQARPGPLTDLRVRRAFSLALDRDEFNRTIAGGEGVWALPGAMAGLFTEAEAKQLLKQDLNEAKRLLAEAGYPNGIELDFPVTTDESQASMTWYQLAQAQVKRAGFNVTLKAQDKAAQRQKMYTGDGDLFANNSYGVLEADNDSILYGLYHSASSGNWSRIKDPDLDKLLEAQRRESDVEKRREAQRSAVRRIVDQMWIVELIYPPKWDLTQTYVRNYHPHFAVRGEGAFVWLDK